MIRFLTNNRINDLFWIISGSSFSIIGVLVLLKFYTINLSEEEYGVYYLSLTISIFINQIFFGPLGNGFSINLNVYVLSLNWAESFK